MRLPACATLILALVFPLLVTAREAGTAESDSRHGTGYPRIDLGILGGAIMPVAGPECVVGGAGMLDLRVSWPVGPVVALGIRVGLGIGGMEWGCGGSDGEEACVPGQHLDGGVWSSYGARATLVPQMGFLAAFDAYEWLTLDVTMGFGMVIPVGDFEHELDGYQYILIVSVGLGGTVRLFRSGAVDIGLALRIDYVGSVLNAIRGYMLPQAGIVVRF
jgi:hypothetical protein